MELNLETINWFAIGTCIIIGQIFLTLWFTLIYGKLWATAYGALDVKQHTAEVPKYTYLIGLVCTAILTIGLAVLQLNLSVEGLGGGIVFGVLISIFFAISTALPGYAFLKRWNTFFLAAGSQTAVIIIISSILAIWK